MRLKVFFIFFFLLRSLILNSQDCHFVYEKENDFARKIKNEINKVVLQQCKNVNDYFITKDSITDALNLKNILKKDDYVFIFGSGSMDLVKGIKAKKIYGLLIPEPQAYLNYAQIISIYPDFRKLSSIFKSKGYEKLIFLFTENSSWTSFYFSMIAREEKLTILSLQVSTPINLISSLSKEINKYDGIIIPIDLKFLEKDFFKMILNEARKNKKEIFSFLKLYIDYGADVIFYIDENDYASHFNEIFNMPYSKGLSEAKKFSVLKGTGAKEVWKNEKIDY